MAQRVNIGIIGAGRIGKVHAETVAFRLPEAVLAAVTDVDQKAAEDLAARTGGPRVFSSADELLRDSSIGAVLICSSTDTHADLS